MQTALITGAAGFIGSHLAEELLERGWSVRGLDDFSTGHRKNLERAGRSDSFSVVDGDVCDPETVRDVMEGVDTVFHQAAVASVPRSFTEPRTVTETNCTGTATVMRAAADASVESVVVASSAAVYGSDGTLPKHEGLPVSPESPYAASKHYTECVARQLGDHFDIDVAALRYFNVYGPRQDPGGQYSAVIPKFIELLLDGRQPTIFGDGEQSRDFVFVEDVVNANVRAATSECSGSVFNVARGRSVTVNELVDKLNDITDRDVTPLYEDPRPGDVRHSVADVSKAADQLEFEPTVSIDRGLERTVEWFRNR